MPFFSSPTSYRLNAIASDGVGPSIVARSFSTSLGILRRGNEHGSHPALGHLILLVFEAVMKVVCVSLPGYILARRGILDADKQRFLAELNVALFTPCLKYVLAFLLLHSTKVLTGSSFHQIGFAVER